MSKAYKKVVNIVGVPCLIITAFFIILLVLAGYYKIEMPALWGGILKRWGMNGVLVLAMVPSVQSGIGLNFGLSLGIVSGLFGAIIAVDLKLVNNPVFAGNPALAAVASFMVAVCIAIVIAALVGFCYGLILNRIKGSEMTVSTYIGFSAIAFMNMVWVNMPLKNGDAILPVGGKGVRNTISLDGYFSGILNKFLGFHIGGGDEAFVPVGLILFFLLTCGLIWLFMRTRSGIALSAAGANPSYAKSSGINPDKTRILGAMLSTIIAAVGIIVYAQSYGFLQFYNAPLMMSFFCVAAVLIGGATVERATILNVIIGTFLFQAVLALSLPVANAAMPGTSLPDIMRIIISNGIILYALTCAGGKKA